MVLFTSAAPGKKAAPRAAPRRRPQPTQPAPSAQGPSQAATNPLPTPEPTQPAATTAVEQSPTLEAAPQLTNPTDAPASEPVREAEVEHARSGAIDAAPLETTTPTSADTVGKASASLSTTTPPPETAPATVEGGQVQVPAAQETTRDEASRTGEQEDAEASTGAAVGGAQQRLGNDDVSQAPVAEIVEATRSEPTLLVEAPKSRRSSRRVDTAKVLDAASAGAVAPKPNAASKRKAKAAPDATSDVPRPAKRIRRTRPKTSHPPPADSQDHSSAVEGVHDAVQDTSPAPARRRQPTRKAAGLKRKANAKSAETVVDSDNENEAVVEEATPATEEESDADEEQPQRARKRQKKVRIDEKPKKPKVRKRKLPKPVADGEEPEEIEEDSGSDPELHEIDPEALSMWDLSHDTFHGKMSERGRAMEAIDWEAEREKRRAAADLIASSGAPVTADGTSSDAAEVTTDGVVQSTEGPSGTVESSAESAKQAETVEADHAEGIEATGPAVEAEAEADVTDGANDIGFMLDDDGNIIADATTLVVDRQADAIAAAGVDRPVEEINDLTTLNNRTTWINENRREAMDRVPLWKWKSDPWSEEETDEFYDALRMFGTDFLIISKMFPPKTRRMIKAKFVREEKLDPERITRALNGQETRKLDLDYYAQKTSREVSIFTKYTSLQDATEKILKETKDRHAELATAAAQEEQRTAEKRIEDSLQKSKQGKKTRKSKKPQMGGMGGFGGGGGPDDD